MTEAEQIMKRCQVGTRNYNEANNLHAECYRVIGKLLKTIEDMESKESNPIKDGWQLSVADGHSGYGVYAHMNEYPEEGAFLLLPIKELESQEPVAWMDADGNVSDNNDHKCFPIPLYTHPPQRTEQEPVACDGDFPEGFDESLGIPAQALRQANAALCEVTNNRMWDVPALAERMLLFCRNTHPPQRTEQEPVGFAGIEMWIGNTRIKKLMTQTELHSAIDPWAIVKFNSDSCIDALKEKNNA